MQRLVYNSATGEVISVIDDVHPDMITWTIFETFDGSPEEVQAKIAELATTRREN